MVLWKFYETADEKRKSKNMAKTKNICWPRKTIPGLLSLECSENITQNDAC
ncbi:MAG: hypothetical protein AB7V36_14615 [Bacteroidales bacterium]